MIKKGFTGDRLFKTAKCPVCGKIFIVPVNNVYKINGKDHCSYSCFRVSQKKAEGKKPVKSKFKGGY